MATTLNQNHTNVKCDRCGVCPIVGARYKCGNCVDYDLCLDCVVHRRQWHDPSHCFLLLDEFVDINATYPPLLSRTVFVGAPPTGVSSQQMEPFQPFGLSHGSVQVLVPRASDRAKESMSLVEFVEKGTTKEDWTPMTVGVAAPDGGNPAAMNRLVDQELRSCLQYNKLVPDLALHPGDRALVDNGVRTFCLPGHAGHAGGEAELMVYTPGGHFAPHTDRIRHHLDPAMTQTGTLLLIGYSPDAQGGELVMDGQTLAARDNTILGNKDWQWKVCIIPIGRQHEVTVLEQGHRIVYKQIVWAKKNPQLFD